MKDAQEFQSTDSHDLLMKLLKHPEIVKNKIQNFIEEEKEIFGDSIEEINDLRDYVMSNWRSIVPPLVAFGLSVLLKYTEDKKVTKPEEESEEPLLN